MHMKSRRIIKKTLKITGTTLLSLLLIAFLIPILFKKQITNLVKKEINKSINAKVDFKDVSLSLLRHFPKVSISIDDLSVVGLGEFEGDTLLYSKQTDASANLFSVLKGKNIKVFGLFLDEPRIHAIMTKDGKANWDIAKETPDTGTPDSDTTASAFKLSLKRYSINNGYLVYDDASSDTYIELENFDHAGSGDFTQDVFTLSTQTEADAASITQGTIPYLANTKADIGADIKIDLTSNTYTFKTDDIALNDLTLSLDGFLQLVNDSTYNMDIKFQSPNNDFKSILSMIPAVYTEDFSDIKTSGEAKFSGWVKGVYDPQRMPAYDVNLEVKNGSFQYPDLPKPVKNIQLSLQAGNTDGQPDNAVINLSKGHLEMDNEPFDFRFLLKNPVTIRYIDAAAKGKLDLSQVTQFVKLPNGTKLSGLVWADAFAKGVMKDLQTQSGTFTAGGFFDIKNLFYSAADFPQPIRNGNMKVELQNTGGVADNTFINVNAGHIEVGNDPVDFTLQLSKPVTAMIFNGSAKGRLTLGNLDQFMSFEKGTSLSGTLNADLKFAGNKAMITSGKYDEINMSGAASLYNVKYIAPDYPTGISIASTTANFNPANVTISQFNGNYLGSNFSGNGNLNNLLGFAINNEPLSGTINVSVDNMNLNAWTGTASTSAASKTGGVTEAGGAFLVPANMNITLNAKAGRVVYDDINYDNINGTVSLKNETVNFNNVKGNAMDGSIVINGDYSTLTNKTKPDIGLSYTIKDMSVQKVFYAFNTVQALMPIGKFLDGKLSSELTMTGSLKDNMMPNLQSLTGKGNLLLIEGVLRKFAPLEKLANTLQIDRLKSISVKDIKNYIEFANGKVLVKPFDIKIDDIVMQIGGMHGFDQSIDYIIDMKVPRRLLGSAGNNLINGLVSSANSKGIPVSVGDMVDLNVKVGGSLSNPAIKVDLEKVVGNAVDDLKEQAKDFAQQKLDSAKQQVKESFEGVKEQVKDELKDKLKEQIFGKDTAKTITPADSTKKPGSGIKQTIKDIFNRPKKNKTDTLKN